MGTHNDQINVQGLDVVFDPLTPLVKNQQGRGTQPQATGLGDQFIESIL